jgi:monoamine oxidase
VQAINWRTGRARVEFTEGDSPRSEVLSGRAALITIPLPLLQSAETPGSIRFEPDLPSIRAAARQLAMGQVVKVLLNFSEPIWHRAGMHRGFLFCPTAMFPTWWLSRPQDANVITGWAGGPPAEKLLAQGSEHLVSMAVQTLADIVQIPESRLRKALSSHYVHDWSRDRFALGAYSYTPVGCFNARSVLATPILETLFFAGEATNTTGAHGTVHGAVESGLLAARQIAQVISK